MFASKKEAEAYDKMLELGEQFSALLMSQMPDMDEKKAEDFGIFMAKNKDSIIEACKGKPEALENIGQTDHTNVTPLLSDTAS
jgi:dsDNA-binding SOS-regulon protein